MVELNFGWNFGTPSSSSSEDSVSEVLSELDLDSEDSEPDSSEPDFESEPEPSEPDSSKRVICKFTTNDYV